VYRIVIAGTMHVHDVLRGRLSVKHGQMTQAFADLLWVEAADGHGQWWNMIEVQHEIDKKSTIGLCVHGWVMLMPEYLWNLTGIWGGRGMYYSYF
jgi:hypothetical protein